MKKIIFNISLIFISLINSQNNTSLSLDGFDDFVSIDNQTIQPNTNSFTFLGKINFNDTSVDYAGYEMVYYTETNSNSFALRLNKALDITLPGEMPNYSLLQANVDGVYVTSNDFGELSNNTWYNVAVVVDQENDLLKLVINSQTYTVGLDINEIIFESNNYGLELNDTTGKVLMLKLTILMVILMILVFGIMH